MIYSCNRGLISHPVVRFSAVLLEHLHIRHHHAAVDCLLHVGYLQQVKLHCGQARKILLPSVLALILSANKAMACLRYEGVLSLAILFSPPVTE